MSTAIACETWRKLPALTAAVVCLAALLARGPAVSAQPPADPPATPAAHESAEHAAATGDAAHEGGSHSESPWPVIAKVTNFVLLTGGLVYLLRRPFGAYLSRRADQIREDLVTAARTTEEAKAQVAAIDEKLKRLPQEIQLLRERGREEVAAEEARIRREAETEQQRLLEHARREIDLQLRAARRELVTQAADLAVQAAREKIAAHITSDDQRRLVDRYLQQVRQQ
jgi:F-type H+-transporting ATPase subunit b